MPGKVEWWEVPEGQMLDAEQLVARFLNLNTVERVNYMQHVIAQARRSNQCTQRNHAGAMHYTMHHRCATEKPKRQRRRQTIRKRRKS